MDGLTTEPAWKDEHGVVHVVALHTNTRIMTECDVLIVRGDVWRQLSVYVAAGKDEPVSCLICLGTYEPY